MARRGQVAAIPVDPVDGLIKTVRSECANPAGPFVGVAGRGVVNLLAHEPGDRLDARGSFKAERVVTTEELDHPDRFDVQQMTQGDRIFQGHRRALRRVLEHRVRSVAEQGDALVGPLIDADAFIAMPGILLAIAFVAFLGPGLRNAILALTLSGWVNYARLVRAQVMAARAVGEGRRLETGVGGNAAANRLRR